MIEAYRATANPRVIGMISGTSADGIDAALVEFEGASPRPKFLQFTCTPYPSKVREMVFALMEHRASVVDVARMNVLLGQLFAEAARTVGEADLIATHGQTIAHVPAVHDFCGYPIRATLQICEPAEIAARLNVPVVSDFRAPDMAVGGQAAPLVPFADAAILHSDAIDRVALNIGGISNFTFIPRQGDIQACDTGPGNCMMDALAERVLNTPCDAKGAFAATGTVQPELLEEMMRHPYFELSGPRSTGREEFGRPYAARFFGRCDARDLMRTAAAFTAETIVRALRSYVKGPAELVAAGGGVENLTLMEELRSRLPDGVRLRRYDEFGVPAEAREAVAFAVLGHQTMHGRRTGVPGATGASRSVVQGKITLV